MRFVPSFVLSVALLTSGSAFGGDAWSRVDGSEILYEEVGDGVFMPEGLYDSLPNADELVGLIEEGQPAEKGIDVSQTVDGESWEQDGLTVHCWTVTTTVKFGTVEVTKRETSCTTT